MKQLASLLGFATLVVCAPVAYGQNPDKIANIEQIFRFSKVDQMQQQMFRQMKSMATSQMQNSGLTDNPSSQAFRDKLFAMLAERMSWEKMKPQYIKLYDEIFTAEEVAGILAFYKTPAGTALLEKMPALMTRSMQIAQQQVNETMPEIKRMLEQETAPRNPATPPHP